MLHCHGDLHMIVDEDRLTVITVHGLVSSRNTAAQLQVPTYSIRVLFGHPQNGLTFIKTASRTPVWMKGVKTDRILKTPTLKIT